MPCDNISNKNVGAWVSTGCWKSGAGNMNSVHSVSSCLEPSVLHRSVLLVMDRAPQNKAVQVVHNETITVLLSLQILNCMTEKYCFLVLKFQSLLVLWKVHIMSFNSDAHCCYSTWFIALMCKAKGTRNSNWPQKYPSWFVYLPCTSLVITKFHKERNKNTSNGFCYLKEPNLLGLSGLVGFTSL